MWSTYAVTFIILIYISSGWWRQAENDLVINLLVVGLAILATAAMLGQAFMLSSGLQVIDLLWCLLPKKNLAANERVEVIFSG